MLEFGGEVVGAHLIEAGSHTPYGTPTGIKLHFMCYMIDEWTNSDKKNISITRTIMNSMITNMKNDQENIFSWCS